MAQRVEKFQTTVTAGSGFVNVASFTFNPGTIDRIEVYFPRGCSGLVAAQIWYGAKQVVPFAGSGKMIGDAETFAVDVDDLPTGAGWEMFASNSDAVYSHTLTTTFWVDELVTTSLLDAPQLILLPAEGGAVGAVVGAAIGSSGGG